MKPLRTISGPQIALPEINHLSVWVIKVIHKIKREKSKEDGCYTSKNSNSFWQNYFASGLGSWFLPKICMAERISTCGSPSRSTLLSAPKMLLLRMWNPQLWLGRESDTTSDRKWAKNHFPLYNWKFYTGSNFLILCLNGTLLKYIVIWLTTKSLKDSWVVPISTLDWIQAKSGIFPAWNPELKTLEMNFIHWVAMDCICCLQLEKGRCAPLGSLWFSGHTKPLDWSGLVYLNLTFLSC